MSILVDFFDSPGAFKVSPFQSYVVAVRNRVFLGRVDYAFVAHAKLSFFVVSSFESDVLVGSSIL